MHKDIKKLLKQARKEGWLVSKPQNKKRQHIMLKHPKADGLVTVPGTPSDCLRTIQNTKAIMRRLLRKKEETS